VTRFVTAIIGQPFGLEGFIRITSLSGETEHLRSLSAVLLRDKNGERRYEIEAFKHQGNQLLIRFKGVDTPEAAKKLSGAELIVSRNEAAPLKEGEFYIEDLKGLNLVPDGNASVPGGSALPLGVITGIIEGGGGSLIEARLGSGETKLIPFRDEFIGEISLENKTAALLNTWILE
jgi:16S rRNA processing protein RimM